MRNADCNSSLTTLAEAWSDPQPLEAFDQALLPRTVILSAATESKPDVSGESIKLILVPSLLSVARIK